MLFLNNEILPSSESHQASATYNVDESQKQTNKQTNTKKQPTKMCSKRSQIQTNAYVQFYLKQEICIYSVRIRRVVTFGRFTVKGHKGIRMWVIF